MGLGGGLNIQTDKDSFADLWKINFLLCQKYAQVYIRHLSSLGFPLFVCVNWSIQREMRARAARQQQEEGEGEKTTVAAASSAHTNIHSKSYRAFMNEIFMPMTASKKKIITVEKVGTQLEESHQLPEVTTFIFKEVFFSCVFLLPSLQLQLHGFPDCTWISGGDSVQPTRRSTQQMP